MTNRILILLLAFVLSAPTFAKPKKVKLGEVVVCEGEVNDNTPAWADKVFSIVSAKSPATTSTDSSSAKQEEATPQKARRLYAGFIKDCKDMQDALPPAERSALFQIGKFKSGIKDTIDCKTYGFLITDKCCMFYTIAGDYIVFYNNRRYCLSKTYKDGSRFHNVVVEQNYTSSAALSFDYNPDKEDYMPTNPRPDNKGYSWMVDNQGIWYGTDGPGTDVYLGTSGERRWNLVKRLWTASETKPELKLNDNGTKRVLSFNQENRKVKSIIPKRIEEEVKPLEEQEAKEEAARKAKEQKIATLKKKLVGTWRNSVNDGTTSITETVKVKADGTFTATFKVKYNEVISPKTKYVYDVSMVIDKGDIVIDESEESILFYTNFMEAHVAGTRKKVGGLSEELDIIALTRITGTLSKFLDYRFYANPSVSQLKSQSNTLNKAAAAAK